MYLLPCFYRAMHFSAKRGIAIACIVYLSLCPSVRLWRWLVDCDHTGWNSSEIISRLLSLGCSLSADPNLRGLLQGEHPEILAQSDPPLLIWASETFDRKLRPNAYRLRNGQNGKPIGNHHRSFEWCHCWPSTTSPSPKMGVPYAHKICEWPYLRNGWSDTLHVCF